MESGQPRCWAQCAPRLAGWKKNLNQKYPMKDMKTPGVVSLSVTATLLTRSNEKWVGRPRYLYWSQGVVNTDQVCHSSNLQEPEETMRRKSEGAWENRKKTFTLFLIASGGQTGVWFGRAFSTHKKTFCIIYFFCACTTKEISLEMTR